MQIQNTNQTNFQGKYIVKGSVKSVEKFGRLMHSHYVDDTYGYVNLRHPDKFWGWEEEVLIPKFDDAQKYTESLHATNDEADILRDFRKNKFESNEAQELKNSKDIYEYADILETRLFNRLRGYFVAMAECENNFCDFMIDRFVEGRKIVNEIFGTGTSKTIKSINADDAIEAMYHGNFDVVNGEILK